MRLISIGSSNQAQIVLRSQYVSGYHAEIFQLDNGDMLLVDKGSRNGTFVNGVQIAPEKEVTVTRNDSIRFADQDLNWSMVPVLSIPDKDNIKVLKSIGSHYLNTIHLSGNQISRFHATVKQTKDGKWYICDHSSNGTTVNGVRIPKDQYVQIKSKDIIQCAGVTVMNPVTDNGNGTLKSILIGLCACVVIVLAVWGVVELFGGSWQSKIYKAYAQSTVVLETGYYLKTDIEYGGTNRWVINDEGEWEPYTGKNPMKSWATGFFISDNGMLVTNLHVVKPWEFGALKDVNESIKRGLLAYARKINISLASSDIKAEGAIAYILAVPNGQIFDSANATKMRVVTYSEKKEVDLAVLHTMTAQLPFGATYIPISNISDENLSVGTDIFTMGFPHLYTLQDVHRFERFQEKPLQATGASGIITMNNDKYNYTFDAASYHGASGSPIFDKKGKLIGVVANGISEAQGYNGGVKAKYITRLIQSTHE